MVKNLSNLSISGFQCDYKNQIEKVKEKGKEKEKILYDIHGDYFSTGAQQSSLSVPVSYPVSVSTDLSPSMIKSPLKEIGIKIESEKTNKIKPSTFLSTVAASAQRVARKWSKTNSATTSTKGSNMISRSDSCKSDSVETVSLSASKSESESVFDANSVVNSLLNLELKEKTKKTKKDVEIEIISKELEIIEAMSLIGSHMTQCNTKSTFINHRTILKDLKSLGNVVEVPATDFVCFGSKLQNLMVKTRLLCDFLSHCDTNDTNMNMNMSSNNIYQFNTVLSCE